MDTFDFDKNKNNNIRIIPNIINLDYPTYITGPPGQGKSSMSDVIADYYKLASKLKRNAIRRSSLKKIISTI